MLRHTKYYVNSEYACNDTTLINPHVSYTKSANKILAIDTHIPNQHLSIKMNDSGDTFLSASMVLGNGIVGRDFMSDTI